MVCKFNHLTRKFKLNLTEIMHKTRIQRTQQSDVELIKKQTILLLLYQLRIIDMYIILTKTCKIHHY